MPEELRIWSWSYRAQLFRRALLRKLVLVEVDLSACERQRERATLVDSQFAGRGSRACACVRALLQAYCRRFRVCPVLRGQARLIVALVTAGCVMCHFEPRIPQSIQHNEEASQFGVFVRMP